MSKRAGWTRREENAFIKLKNSELLLQLHAQVWGGRWSRLTERSLKEPAQIGCGTRRRNDIPYNTIRYLALSYRLASLITSPESLTVSDCTNYAYCNYITVYTYLPLHVHLPLLLSVSVDFVPFFAPATCKILLDPGQNR